MMKRLLGLLALLGCSTSCAQSPGTTISYNAWARYPLLNTSEQATIYGDPEVPIEQLKKSGNAYHKASVLGYSALCKAEKYSCAALETADEDPDWPVYALSSLNPKEKASGPFELKLGVSARHTIESVLLYFPARAETGLLMQELRVIDAMMRTFTGQSVNQSGLKKCYSVAREDGREKCVVQTAKVNGQMYQITVNFLTLDHPVGRPLEANDKQTLRNFSVKVLPLRQ